MSILYPHFKKHSGAHTVAACVAGHIFVYWFSKVNQLDDIAYWRACFWWSTWIELLTSRLWNDLSTPELWPPISTHKTFVHLVDQGLVFGPGPTIRVLITKGRAWLSWCGSTVPEQRGSSEILKESAYNIKATIYLCCLSLLPLALRGLSIS